MKNKWQRWMNISRKVVSLEASIFFGIIFIIIIIPISGLIRLIRPDIFLGSGYVKNRNSFWNKIPKIKYDLKFARKQ